MRILAIIPARGGSKRIPRKNIKDFCGLPIIAYSIRAAVRAGCFSEVMVSTDDSYIASLAKAYGAKVPFLRSDDTANDYATTADVISEVLAAYEKQGRTFDAVACIYATAPFISVHRLREAADIINSGKAQGAFTCVQYSYPIQRSLAIGEDGRIRMKFPEYATARSQDLQKSYHDAGQFYFTTVDAFRRNNSLWGDDTLPIELPELEVQDLDTPQDWRIAEMKYNMLRFPDHIHLDGYLLISYPVLSNELLMKMLEGRNADDIRLHMVNPDTIGEDNHYLFTKNLVSARNKQYYAIVDCTDETAPADEIKVIGSVNFESISENEMERGIWLFEEGRGKGHANRMLKEAYRWLRDNRGVKSIYTKVKDNNEASISLELSLGAKEIQSDQSLRGVDPTEQDLPGYRHFRLPLEDDPLPF